MKRKFFSPLVLSILVFSFTQGAFAIDVTFNGTNFVVDGVPITDSRQIVEFDADLANYELGIKIGELPLKKAIEANIAQTSSTFNCECGITGTGITDDEYENLLFTGCQHTWDFNVGNITNKEGLNLSFKVQQGVYSKIRIPNPNPAAYICPCITPHKPVVYDNKQCKCYPPGSPWPVDKNIPCNIEIDELAEYSADATSIIKTKIENNNLKFIIEIKNVSDAELSGKVVMLAKVVLFSFMNPVMPGAGTGVTEGITKHFIDKISLKMANSQVIGTEIEKKGIDFQLFNEKANEFFQRFANIQNANLLTLYETEFVNTITSGEETTKYGGLWLRFRFNQETLQKILDALEPIAEYQDNIQMAKFDLTKINSNHNKLIISLAGAGPYKNGAMFQTNSALETIVKGNVPFTNDHFGDEIYQIGANYVDNKTVAVIGYPWITIGSTTEDLDSYWGPNKTIFSAKIKQALDQMAPHSKLVLVGKSLGACRLQQVAQELNALGVPVNLMILVDASCTPNDQSSNVVSISSNIKKVYNFRQTMPEPENNGQNGYQISFSAPTIGTDINVNESMCENVGHDGIDECTLLQQEIHKYIRTEFPISIQPILNLLFD